MKKKTITGWTILDTKEGFWCEDFGRDITLFKTKRAAIIEDSFGETVDRERWRRLRENGYRAAKVTITF